MTVDAENLKVEVRVISTKSLPELVINLSLPGLRANSPTVPTLPIVPNQDSLPSLLPIFLASILLIEGWAKPFLSRLGLGLEE